MESLQLNIAEIDGTHEFQILDIWRMSWINVWKNCFLVEDFILVVSIASHLHMYSVPAVAQ